MAHLSTPNCKDIRRVFFSGDVEIQLLKERLLETERAMAKIVEQMQQVNVSFDFAERVSVTNLIFDTSLQAGGLVKEVANGGDGDTGKKSVADDKVRFSISFKGIDQH